MSQTVSEFVYLRLKPSVKPEDPSNVEGREFLDALRTTKVQSGYLSSAWGRTLEDENCLVWVIDWSDARGSSRASQLSHFLEPNTSALTLYTTLQPPLSTSDTLTANPVTELAALTFPSSLSPDEHKKLNADLIRFRTTLIEKLPGGKAPRSWSMGQVERPGTVDHRKSPSGQALVHFVAVGWDSVETHMAARDTKEFAETIEPIRQKTLGPAEGLDMKHVSFRRLE